MNIRGFLEWIGIGTAAVVASPIILAERTENRNIQQSTPSIQPPPSEVESEWYEDAQEGYDYVIGVYLGDLVDPSVVSVWRKGTNEYPVIQAAEYEITGDVFEENLFKVCTFLAKKYGQYLPDGPMFSIEQVVAPGDTLQHLLKLNGYHRFHKIKRYNAQTQQEKIKEGWYPSSWSRPIMVERFLTAFQEKWIEVGSKSLRTDIMEAAISTTNGSEFVIPKSHKFSNRFMAAAISVNSILGF
jgi:hypothetical protein